MKTITMYTLLGMVKDGKAPKKIKYQNEIYTTDDVEYFCYKSGNRTPLFEHIFDYYSDYDALNEEVIILDNLEEEKKIPEKLDDFTIAVGKVDESNIEEYIQTLFNQQYEIFNKINSIIDYLKSKVE